MHLALCPTGVPTYLLKNFLYSKFTWIQRYYDFHIEIGQLLTQNSKPEISWRIIPRRNTMIPIFASLPESSQTKAVMEYLYELGNRREWNKLEKVLHEILSCNGFHKLKAQALEYAVFMGLQRKEQRQALGYYHDLCRLEDDCGPFRTQRAQAVAYLVRLFENSPQSVLVPWCELVCEDLPPFAQYLCGRSGLFLLKNLCKNRELTSACVVFRLFKRLPVRICDTYLREAKVILQRQRER